MEGGEPAGALQPVHDYGVRLGFDSHIERFVLVSLTTGERVVLPNARRLPWHLGVDEDGDAFVSSDDQSQVLTALEVFRLSLFRNDQGRMLVLESVSPVRTDRYWLDEASSRFSLASMKSQLPNVTASLHFHFAVFFRPRHGFKLYWDIAAALRTTSIFTSSVKVSRWLHKAWDRWERLLRDYNMQGHLLKSQQYEDNVARHGVDSERVLPFCSASSASFIFLLSVFAFSPRVAGGFASDEHRSSCRLVMRAVLRPLMTLTFSLKLFMDDKVQHKPPMPPQGANPYKLDVECGWVDMQKFRQDIADFGPRSWARGFSAVRIVSRAPLDEVFAMVFGGSRKALGNLCEQLAFAAGTLMETFMVPLASSGGDICRGVTIQPVTIDLYNDYQLERELVRYREGSLQEAGGSALTFLSGSTDKSRVFGMGLANCCFAKPNNRAWWAAPAVHARTGFGGARLWVPDPISVLL